MRASIYVILLALIQTLVAESGETQSRPEHQDKGRFRSNLPVYVSSNITSRIAPKFRSKMKAVGLDVGVAGFLTSVKTVYGLLTDRQNAPDDCVQMTRDLEAIQGIVADLHNAFKKNSSVSHAFFAEVHGFEAIINVSEEL